ncbi:MAG: L-2-hydroxyglutarate oxidase [Candidatus Cloacimonetes bacterium]|nr:L-2-hydroxyglutarate oxidase [Candidatus Cloacimonadota bacterium]
MQFDYMIVGAGIIGLTIAYELINRDPKLSIVIIDKEEAVALHSSGRNSGVLHAGFYYTSDSLKARFCVEGNRKMKLFCKEHGIFVRPSKKVVVAKDESEIDGLFELHDRGLKNSVDVELISEDDLRDLDPNVNTHIKALFSPSTASVNPKEVCIALELYLKKRGVQFQFEKAFNKSMISNSHYLINCAGLYADKIAQDFGLAKNYVLLPFKGIYYKFMGDVPPTKLNIYPVPNLKNPFLGVHYTITSDNHVKIGPTAIPAFWRENYSNFNNFSFNELLETLYFNSKLLLQDSFNFRQLALEEFQNYQKSYFVKKASKLVHFQENNFSKMIAGIRAQLLNKKTNELLMDFVVEHDDQSTHILNAVSPAFTCSFAFAEYLVDEINKNRKIKCS